MSTTFADFIRQVLAGQGPGARSELRLGWTIGLLRLALQVRRERNQLARLSHAQLTEMGIHPADAEREAARGLFDLPKSRLDKI